MAERPLIIGLGNALRGDDGAGLMVAELLAGHGLDVVRCDGEPVSLLELWRGFESVVIIDAVSGAQPGRTWRLHADAEELPVIFAGQTSTHLLGLGEVIELARTLGRLPARLTLIGIEGNRFSLGTKPSLAVEGAVVDLAAALLAEADDGWPEPNATDRRPSGARC